jgi:inner membrane transporter RhtA
VPFLADLVTLRRVPANFFGLFMSVNPMLAALAGLVILGQSLAWSGWLAIAAIMAANVISVLAPGGRGRGDPGQRGGCARPQPAFGTAGGCGPRRITLEGQSIQS